MRASVLAIAMLVASCGGDDPPPPPTKAGGGGGGGAAAAAKPKGKGKELKPMRRIEDRVACPTPSDAKKCNPKAPTCGPQQYCLAAGKEHYCGPCPERDAIRHVFKPRDFQGADLRDPFQSFVISQPGLGQTQEGPVKDVTPKCTRKDQFVASSYNYQALQLKGIITQGAQRKVLLMGGNLGYIVKKGDCVGKEKALVKDIGAEFITFQVEAAGKADPIETSMILHPTQVSMSAPEAIDPGAASTPIVAPPSGSAPQAPTAQEQGGTTTTIVRPPPPQQPPPQPAPAPRQAPTQINP